MSKTFGCFPDPVDKKDYLLSRFVEHIPFPDILDLRSMVKVIDNQGSVPACVGYNCSQIKEVADNISGEWKKLSGIWLYHQCKLSDDNCYEGGTTIRNAMRVLAKRGCVPSEYVPYDGCYDFDSFDCLGIDEELAAPYRIKTYARLTSLEDMFHCLHQHGAFAMGIQVTDSFEKTGKDGIVSLDCNTIGGGHCIPVLGYNINESIFYIGNSWSTSWGYGGFAQLPFDYWERYGMDAWGCIDISPNEI